MHVSVGEPRLTSQPSLRSRISRIAAAALVCTLWLSCLQWPIPANGELDPSWQEGLIDASLRQRQFGSDLIFTFGPWGHTAVGFMMSEGVAPHVTLEIFAKLILAIFVVSFSWALKPLRRSVFLAIAGILTPWMPDTYILLTSVALLLRWMDRSRAHDRLATLAAVALAFLSLIKFSNTVVIGFGMAVVAVTLILERRWSDVLRMVGAYSAGLALFWVSASQSLSSFPAFITSSLELAAGYPSAMSSEETWPVFLVGAGLLLVHATCLLALATERPLRISRWAAAAVIGASVFLSWKHGFTRADAHVMSFFMYSMLIALALPALVSGRASRWWWPAIVVPLALLGMWTAVPQILQIAPAATVARIRSNIEVLNDLSRWRRGFDAGLAQNTNAAAFPLTRAAVGEATVDIFGFEIGLALLNRLNYTPRPIPQSYAAYTPRLLERNRAFLESPGAPQYILGILVAIDNRFPAQDDASWLADLPRRYEPVLSERGRLLVRRRAAPLPAGPVQLTPLLEMPIRVGEEFDLPTARDHVLWLQFDIDSTFLGRLRAALYKPPPLGLTVVSESGATQAYRAIPGVAQSGFVVQPVLATQSDFEGFMIGRGRTWARSIRIDAQPEHRRYWGEVRIRVSRIDSLPLS